MSRDRSDAIEITWTGVDGKRRRLLFEPRDAGGFTRIAQRREACGWVTEGNEIVNDVVLDQGGEVVV